MTPEEQCRGNIRAIEKVLDDLERAAQPNKELVNALVAYEQIIKQARDVVFKTTPDVKFIGDDDHEKIDLLFDILDGDAWREAHKQASAAIAQVQIREFREHQEKYAGGAPAPAAEERDFEARMEAKAEEGDVCPRCQGVYCEGC